MDDEHLSNMDSEITFDGSFDADIISFIRNFELCLASREIDVKKDTERACCELALCLVGNAKIYFNQLKLEDLQDKTGETATWSYQKLKNLLLNNFKTLKTPGDRLTSLLKMKQSKSESIDSYIKRFNKALVNTKLADSIEDAEQQKMSIFTNGLSTSLRMELQMNLHHHSSLLSVMGQARRLESLMGMTPKMEITGLESSSDEEPGF